MLTNMTGQSRNLSQNQQESKMDKQENTNNSFQLLGPLGMVWGQV